MGFLKSIETLKKEFLEAAKRAARTPTYNNNFKARKAYEALPEAAKRQLKEAGIKLDFLKKD